MTQVVQRRPAPSAPESEPAVVPPLLAQMLGEPSFYTWRGQECHFRRLGAGPPLVLVHDADVGGSCAEWRRNIEPLSSTFTVYAVDLPGFGLSEICPARYTAEHCIQFLRSFLTDVAGSPACAVGSGRGASYLIHVATRWPQTIERTALVAPTGLSAFRPPLAGGLTFGLLRLPGLQKLVLDSTTGHGAIMEHLKHDVYAEELMAGAQDADARYWVTHRPAADYLECSRLAGLLNVRIRDEVRRLAQPTLLAWGRAADKPPITDAELFLELKPDTGFLVFEKSGCRPHEEEPGRFCERVTEYLQVPALAAAA